MNPTVACVGIAALDLVHGVDAIPAQPVKLRARWYDETLGGMAAMAACTIARLGGAAQFWGPLGDDAFGATLRGALADAGVDVVLPPLAGTTSAHSAVLVDAAGERLLVNHRGSALACGAHVLPVERLRADALLADVRWPQGAAALLERANALGIPTVLDADVGEPEALAALVPRARHAIFSEGGFAQWDGAAAGSQAGSAALRALAGDTASVAAVTLGARGVLVASRDGVRALPAFAVDVAETLGAGDVFHGAYALAIAEGRPADAAMRFASAAAAIRCTRRGGVAALPSRAEVDGLLVRA